MLELICRRGVYIKYSLNATEEYDYQKLGIKFTQINSLH